MEFNYEKLDVAKLSKGLIREIYTLTKIFPSSEIYGLTSQIRRAAVSVLLNIAEGNIRRTKKDFCNFIITSISSLVEVDCALKIALDLDFIEQANYKNLEPKIKELYFKLVALSKYLKS